MSIMYKKAVLSLFLVLFSGMAILKAQATGNNLIDVIMKGYSAKVFTSIPVTESETDLIVKSGLKAPSGRNSQSWKFTVVKDGAVNKEIMPDITPGNILIVVSGLDPEQGGKNSDFDCALATENMYIAAQSLGLGAHIYMSPVNNINSTMKQALGIPEGYRAVVILRIGNVDKNIDAVSSASSRKKQEEVVIYK